MTYFDYDKALEILKGDLTAANFLQANKDRLAELGTEAGQEVLLNIVELFAAGKNLEAWKLFYGSKDTSWATLARGAAEDVANTAKMADEWAKFRDFLVSAGTLATKALLSVLVAGFCG
jgi:putative intracellular protease/amidase